MIQLISYDKTSWNVKDKKYIIRELNNPKSFDEFDINVIDLRNERIWTDQGYDFTVIDMYNDLKNINIIMENSQKSNIIVILPQDIKARYYWIGDEYRYSIKLKSNLDLIKSTVSDINFIPLDLLIYENTTTRIKEYSYESAFYFNCSWGEVLTKSIKSEKPTTVRLDEVIMTTLDIDSEEKLKEFLYKVDLLEDKTALPQWLQSFKFFDDNDQENIITKGKIRIEEESRIINQAKEVLKKNNEYKSILYTNGDNLVEVVFEILQQILNYDLSQFIDEKKEDFLIKKQDITFLGEIKGVTSNVKSEHVSQLDVHLHGYLDEMQGNDEVVKSILIINHQRNNPLDIRQPVHETQIKLAERNGSLIIETITLLRIFEKYLTEELTSEDIEKMFIDNVGLLRVD